MRDADEVEGKRVGAKVNMPQLANYHRAHLAPSSNACRRGAPTVFIVSTGPLSPSITKIHPVVMNIKREFPASGPVFRLGDSGRSREFHTATWETLWQSIRKVLWLRIQLLGGSSDTRLIGKVRKLKGEGTGSFCH